MICFASQLLVLSSMLSIYIAQSSKSRQYHCAIDNILEAFYTINRQFSIRTYGEDSANGDLLSSKCLRNNILPYTLRNFNTGNEFDRFTLDESGMLTFDSVSSLKQFNNRVDLTNTLPKSFLFLVHCRTATLSQIAALDDTVILHFQYFLFEDEDYVRLMTFVWHTPRQCNVTQLIEVNKFNKNL